MPANQQYLLEEQICSVLSSLPQPSSNGRPITKRLSLNDSTQERNKREDCFQCPDIFPYKEIGRVASAGKQEDDTDFAFWSTWAVSSVSNGSMFKEKARPPPTPSAERGPMPMPEQLYVCTETHPFYQDRCAVCTQPPRAAGYPVARRHKKTKPIKLHYASFIPILTHEDDVDEDEKAFIAGMMKMSKEIWSRVENAIAKPLMEMTSYEENYIYDLLRSIYDEIISHCPTPQIEVETKDDAEKEKPVKPEEEDFGHVRQVETKDDDETETAVKPEGEDIGNVLEMDTKDDVEKERAVKPEGKDSANVRELETKDDVEKERAVKTEEEDSGNVSQVLEEYDEVEVREEIISIGIHKGKVY